MDFGINSQDGKRAEVSVDDRSSIAKMRKLIAEHPDEVVVKALPEENDGNLLIEVPFKWIKVKPPRHVSDEQRAMASERMKRINKSISVSH